MEPIAEVGSDSELTLQRRLSREQVEAFDHLEFVKDQVADFASLNKDAKASETVVIDVGGGTGHFAGQLEADGWKVRVIDVDPPSIARCRERGVDAIEGDALDPPMRGDEKRVAFNLVLHHLVGKTEAETRAMQLKALRAWVGQADAVFVNEYIYDSLAGDASGSLIFHLTGGRGISAVLELFSAVVPAFRANTFGVGVRFRSRAAWQDLFEEAGYRCESATKGAEEPVLLLWRLLLIRSIRRDSFLLRPLR